MSRLTTSEAVDSLAFSPALVVFLSIVPVPLVHLGLPNRVAITLPKLNLQIGEGERRGGSYCTCSCSPVVRCRGLDASEVEDAFLTVFHFGYWAASSDVVPSWPSSQIDCECLLFVFIGASKPLLT